MIRVGVVTAGTSEKADVAACFRLIVALIDSLDKNNAGDARPLSEPTAFGGRTNGSSCFLAFGMA